MQETKALISAMTGESRGGYRAAAPGCAQVSKDKDLDTLEGSVLAHKYCMIPFTRSAQTGQSHRGRKQISGVQELSGGQFGG